MKKAILVIVCLFGSGLLAAQVQAGSGAAEAPAPASASVARDHPNSHAPELTGTDIAQLLDLKVVKGRLPDVDGLRIGSYELLFRDHKGRVEKLGINKSNATPYRYEANADGNRDGELLMALSKGKRRNEMEVTLIARTGRSWGVQKERIKVPKNVAMSWSEFNGWAGKERSDWRSIVPIGDTEVFTFHRDGAPEGELPAAVILRVYPEAAKQTAETTP